MLRARLPLLRSSQRPLFIAAFVGAVLMVTNSIYLAIAAHVLGIGRDPETLPLTYQIMLALHIALGIGAALATLGFVVAHVRRMLRVQRAWMRSSGAAVSVLWLVLAVSGLFILSEANSRENAWVFVLHQIAAVGLLFGYLLHRRLSPHPPERASVQRVGWLLASGLFAVWLVHYIESGRGELAPITTAAAASTATSDVAQAAHTDIPALLSPFRAPGDPDPNSPLFPSKTTTTTGGYLPSRILTHDDLPDLAAFLAETRAQGFAPSYYLGAQSCARCHADIVEQWATSAHRFASFNNPFYRRSVELTREKVGRKRSQFCGGCHDPAIMLAGNMEKEIDPLTPEAQAGLTCLACHAIDKIHDKTGNGNYNIHDQTESPYLFDLSKAPLARTVHDYVLKAKPAVHKQRMLKPFFRESEFCLSCHKVNLDVHVNDYRWLRGQNDYDAWQNSGFAHSNPATWYEPPAVKRCQDCHMAEEPATHGDVSAHRGKVASHRFLGVNTALPQLRGDHASIERIETFLRDAKLRVDVFAIHREDGSVVFPLDRVAPVLRPGEVVQVDVVVRNLGVGHTFPGGTNDSNEGWIDFSARTVDAEVYRSGAIGADKHVDRSAHFYRAVMVDKRGERIAMRNATDIYTTVYANVIRPSTSDIARYKFRVPKLPDGSKLELSATLRWRKFNQEFTEFVFAGKPLPTLPITDIAASRVNLTVKTSPPVRADVTPQPDDWKRYNDYGVGLMLDEDTRGALNAFKVVAQLQPQQLDGWLNQARVYLVDGSLDRAEEMLRRASEVAPDQPRAAFFWGQLLEKSGRLTESVQAYRSTLQTYPNSRDTWTRLGRVYWLRGEVKDSIAAYLKVLEIDPEHAQSYHQLALAYNQLAQSERGAELREKYRHAAAEAERGFEKYKLDEDAQKVTARYREQHPEDNRMSQTIVVHAQEGL
jgi:tetratricopeptide (TPR) repeat protein